MITSATRDRFRWAYDLTVKQAFITRENIDSLVSSVGFGGDVDC